MINGIDKNINYVNACQKQCTTVHLKMKREYQINAKLPSSMIDLLQQEQPQASVLAVKYLQPIYTL